MKFHRDVVGAIGRTPLIRLRAASEATGCTILGKAEFMNPGGSVKDRAALAIVGDAVARGALRPGGIIVEGTAGNTGIGMALVAGALGYRSTIVIPDTQSQEKKDMLRLAGAELIEVPAVPYADPNNYVRYSGRLAEALARTEPGGAVWANQFDNVANRRGHYETTGPEIHDDSTARWTASYARSAPAGRSPASAWRSRSATATSRSPSPIRRARRSTPGTPPESSEASGSSITEGIGQGRVTANLEGRAGRLRLPDPGRGGAADRLRPRRRGGPAARRLVGVNIAGAIRLARDLGPGHTIVTILCDSGARYASKLFNPAFLRAKNLPVPAWLEAAGGAPEVFVR